MTAFKGRPKRNQKDIDSFAEGADVSTNTENVSQEKREKKKSQKQEPFYTTLNPEFLEAIKVIAWHERISQREVVEQAILQTFDLESEEYQAKKEEYEAKN